MTESDLIKRLRTLGDQVADRERELCASRGAQSVLQQELDSVKAELTAAREELRNESTKAQLLSSRLARANEELNQARLGLSDCTKEKDTLNRTLGRVQDQLTNLRADAQGKGVQLAELQAYYEGMLEAKEASIASLQSLLENQQHSFSEQQELWEEQRRSLKGSLMDLSDRVDASKALTARAAEEQQRKHDAAVQELQVRLSAAETALAEARARERHVATVLKEHERHASRAAGQQRTQLRDESLFPSDVDSRRRDADLRHGRRAKGMDVVARTSLDGSVVSAAGSSSCASDGLAGGAADVRRGASAGHGAAGSSGGRDAAPEVVQLAMQVRWTGIGPHGKPRQLCHAAACGRSGLYL